MWRRRLDPEARVTRGGKSTAQQWADIVGSLIKRLCETISNATSVPLLSLFLLPVILPSAPVLLSRISYRLSAGQTKRGARNWVSHLLPDMIDKSLPSVISAKLLFRRAAARAHTQPSLFLHFSTSSYSSSNRRSTATCLFARTAAVQPRRGGLCRGHSSRRILLRENCSTIPRLILISRKMLSSSD